MNKILVFVFTLFTSVAFSQNMEHIGGGHFVKRIEYNLVALAFNNSHDSNRKGVYNLKSKGDIEKLFFDNFNAPVEFFFNPSSEYNPCIPSGLRIVRDSSDSSYILEVKYISNYREADKLASEEAREKQKCQIIDVPIEILDSLPKNIFNLIFDYNNSIPFYKVYNEELLKNFKVETLSFPVSNQLAVKLYEYILLFINNFKAKGVPPIIVDGYSVTFRTAVEDEVWSLNIHIPQGNALKMSDFCRGIIEDAINGKFDESKYLELLN